MLKMLNLSAEKKLKFENIVLLIVNFYKEYKFYILIIFKNKKIGKIKNYFLDWNTL